MAKLQIVDSAKVVITSKANKRFVYKDGKRSDEQAKNEKGKGLYSYEFASEDYGKGRITSSKDGLAFGSVVEVPVGSEVAVRAESSAGSSFASVVYSFVIE